MSADREITIHTWLNRHSLCTGIDYFVSRCSLVSQHDLSKLELKESTVNGLLMRHRGRKVSNMFVEKNNDLWTIVQIAQRTVGMSSNPSLINLNLYHLHITYSIHQ